MSRRTIHWSLEAAVGYDSAVAFMRERSAKSAGRMINDMNAAPARLTRRNIARRGRVAGTFELSLPKWKHILAFEMRAVGDGEEIYILHVIHTARDWPSGGCVPRRLIHASLPGCRAAAVRGP